MMTSTGIQIGERATARATRTANRAATREIPTTPRIPATTRPTMAPMKITGLNLMAMMRMAAIRRTLRKVFIPEKPGTPGKVAEKHNALSPAFFRAFCLGVPATPPIPVVCAVIEHGGRLLLAQRPVDKHLPLKWEFAGGKVEPGEEPAAAILREIREELGCTVVITRALPRFLYDYTRVVIEMIPFVCVLAQDSPCLIRMSTWRWRGSGPMN